MKRVTRKLPAIHDKTAALLKEAAELGDDFLQYVYGIAMLHLVDHSDIIAALHNEPSLRSPAALAILRQLWPTPRRLPQPQEGTMPLDARCQSCRYWTGKDAPAGECRRFPPVQSSIIHGDVMSAAAPQWPATNDDDWCGEWQIAAKR
jgi:hypothetical protein